MKHTLTMAQAQTQLPALCRKGKTSVITQKGKTVAYIIPQTWMAKLLQHLESMETLANSEAMAVPQRRKSKKTAKRR